MSTYENPSTDKLSRAINYLGTQAHGWRSPDRPQPNQLHKGVRTCPGAFSPPAYKTDSSLIDSQATVKHLSWAFRSEGSRRHQALAAFPATAAVILSTMFFSATWWVWVDWCHVRCVSKQIEKEQNRTICFWNPTFSPFSNEVQPFLAYLHPGDALSQQVRVDKGDLATFNFY